MAKEDKKTEKRVLRVMPASPDAEMCVLGALLIDDKAADLIMPTLQEDDFYVAANRIIYRVMNELRQQSTPIDTLSVSDRLELQGKLNAVGSIEYLSELVESVPSAANAKYYADMVKRDSLTRKVIAIGNDIVEYAYGCTEGKDALERAEELVYKLSGDNSVRALTHVEKALVEAVKNIQDAQAGNVPRNFIFTGMPKFDSLTKGLKPGEFFILAARPSVGKAALALNIATNCALKGKTVAIFNMEMSAPQLVKRMLAYLSGISFENMDTRGGIPDSKYENLQEAYNRLLGTNLYIDDYTLNRPTDILSKCRRLKRDKGLGLVVVDYLQLMEAESRGRSSESRQTDISDISRKLKIFAKELGVPILALSQLSRGVEKEGRAPQLSDLRDSGAIEQDADIVAFLHDPSKTDANLPDDDSFAHQKKQKRLLR